MQPRKDSLILYVSPEPKQTTSFFSSMFSWLYKKNNKIVYQTDDDKL